MTERKTPIDQALDLFFFAPLGLALVAREELPRLIEKGRQQVSQQMTTARVMGEYAVKTEGPKLVKQAQARLGDLRPSKPPVPNGAGPARAAGPTTPAATAASTPQTTAAPPQPAPPAGAAAPSGPLSTTPPAPKPSGAELAIPGYDALSASQVVTRLAGLSRQELDAVDAYEQATRHRKTILSRIAQLQSGTPAGH